LGELCRKKGTFGGTNTYSPETHSQFPSNALILQAIKVVPQEGGGASFKRKKGSGKVPMFGLKVQQRKRGKKVHKQNQARL